MKLLSNIKDHSILQLFSSRVVIQICTILQSIIIARILGPEGKGYFTEVIIYPTLIGSIAMFGFYTGIVKLAAKKNIRDRYNITNTIIHCCFISGIIGSLIAAVINYSLFYKYEVFKTAALVYSIYVLVYTLNRGLSAFNNGTRNFKLFSISSVILYPTYFIVIFLLFILKQITVSSCIYALLFANIVSLCYLYYKNEEKYSNKESFSSKRLFRYSAKFSIADLSEPIYLYFDKALLAIFISAYDLGLYTIAISSAGLINLFSNTFSIKLFSDVANKEVSNILHYVRLNILLMLLSALLMAIILPIIIPLVYGKQYVESVIPSIIALAICIIQGQSYILERSILATGRPYVGVTAKIIGMITLGVLLSILYVIGCANVTNATIAAVITSLAYYIYISRRAKVIFHIKESFIPGRIDVDKFAVQIKSLLAK